MNYLKRLIHWCSLLTLFAIFFLPLASQAKVIADHLDKIYHREDCALVKDIKERNIREIDSEAEADAKGYFPCVKCITPARQPSLKVKAIKKLSLPVARETIYIGDKKKKYYHHQWCELVEGVSKKNRIRFLSAKNASERGYTACKECNPPVMFNRNKVAAPEIEESAPESSEETELPEAELEE